MLYLIGLGLNENSLSSEAIKELEKCKKIYLETYTINFPYDTALLENKINNKIIPLNRNDVESNQIVKESKKENIALLVYGSPLFATTHISILIEAEKLKVKTRIIYSASVFDAISETGLQLYKFGKISSMPKFQKSFRPDSFLEFVEQNSSIKAHSLILIDIGLELNDALDELESSVNIRENKIKIDKLLVCSRLGTKDSKIYYGTIDKLKKIKVLLPYCIIIPSEMHFIEKESIERFLVK